MKHFLSYLFSALLILLTSCSFETAKNADKTFSKKDLLVIPHISLTLLGHHQVRINDEKTVDISKLLHKLKARNLGKKTIASLSMPKDIPMGELTDVQHVLRKAELQHINYSVLRTEH